MITVSNEFKTAMREPVKELNASIVYDGTSIADDNDLLSYKVSGEGGLGKTVMRKLEASFLGEHNPLGKWVAVGFGCKIDNGGYEHLSYGNFKITELTTSKDSDTTSVVGYDRMVETMKPYTTLEVSYPITLLQYTKKLCEACGVELGNVSLGNMDDWPVDGELWENIDGITYRDILSQIAQITGSVCMVGGDEKIYFKQLTDTGETLTYDNLMKLKLEDVYGEINSVVLSRSPMVGEDAFVRDEESINTNGLTEYKVENNELVDKNREGAVQPIFDTVHGIKYYPFEANTAGFGWYEVGDGITIETDAGELFQTYVLSYSVSIDGGIKETLKAKAESKTATQYQYATAIDKRIKNTEVIVNKQEQYIQMLVEDKEGVDEKFAEINVKLDEITNSVQNSGGNNLMKNSVMFSHNNGEPTDWDVSGAGQLSIQSDTTSLNSGCLSGHSFILNDKTVSQRVLVKVSADDDVSSYSFSVRIKKGVSGYCTVRLHNSVEVYDNVIELKSGEEANYKEYTIKDLHPKDGYYIVEFYGSAESDATFTDAMLSVGENTSKWTQASGELMNTQVNISIDGVLVRSSVYEGDYTAVTPLEFAGYSSINGTPTKVFSLNRDTTNVKKLEADAEVKMQSIKIVPITSGDIQGWAFVPVS